MQSKAGHEGARSESKDDTDLPLPDTEMTSSFPNLSLKLLRERSHIHVQLDGGESVPQLLLLVLPEGVKVVGDAPLEEHRLLRHDREPFTEEADMGTGDVLPVDLDLSSTDE